MRADDPYKSFRFRVVWDGRVVAGFAPFSAPRTRPRRLGRSKWDAVTLDRGVTHDSSFEQWAAGASERGVTRRPATLVVQEHDEAGRLEHTYRLLRSWVSEYQALSDLDANANAVEIEHLKLAHEGFERDDGVPPPMR